jgi:hypothetical protein
MQTLGSKSLLKAIAMLRAKLGRMTILLSGQEF